MNAGLALPLRPAVVPPLSKPGRFRTSPASRKCLSHCACLQARSFLSPVESSLSTMLCKPTPCLRLSGDGREVDGRACAFLPGPPWLGQGPTGRILGALGTIIAFPQVLCSQLLEAWEHVIATRGRCPAGHGSDVLGSVSWKLQLCF